MTQQQKSDGPSAIAYDPATRQPKYGDLQAAPLQVAQPRTTKLDLFAATVEYDLGFARLNSTTSTQHYTDDLKLDGTPLFSVLLPPSLGVGKTSINTQIGFRRTSEELRLVSQTQGSLQWLLGLFYSTAPSARPRTTSTPPIPPCSGRCCWWGRTPTRCSPTRRPLSTAT
jgi:hypothetical protein